MDENKFIDSEGKFVDAHKGSSSIEDLVKESLKTHGIVDTLSEDTNWHTKFSRYGYGDPYNALTGCKEYIFFTKPDLNLLDVSGTRLAHEETNYSSWDLANNSYLVDTFNRMPHLFYQWSSSSGKGGPFMNMITNSARSNLELPGASSKDIETGSNIFGTKITYRGTSWSSDEQFDFNIEFQDNKYFEMYHLFKIYDEYERLKAIGKVTPSKIYRSNRVIHDQFTAFKIVVGPDGRELIYWGRATGVFPTSFPRDTFGNMNDMIADSQRFSVSFKAHFARDFDPVILTHFNRLSLKDYDGGQDLTIKDDMYHDVPVENIPNQWNGNKNGDWAVRPAIIKEASNYVSMDSHKPLYKYKLIWLDR